MFTRQFCIAAAVLVLAAGAQAQGVKSYPQAKPRVPVKQPIYKVPVYTPPVFKVPVYYKPFPVYRSPYPVYRSPYRSPYFPTFPRYGW